MLLLPTVLLRHDSRAGSHFDWLLADPHDHAGRLWTARVEIASRNWAAAKCWSLIPIAPHRRVYLRYQGPLTEGRGRVTRVDAGTFVPRLWSASRMVMDVRMRHFEGAIELRRISDAQWRAAVAFTEQGVDDAID